MIRSLLNGSKPQTGDPDGVLFTQLIHYMDTIGLNVIVKQGVITGVVRSKDNIYIDVKKPGQEIYLPERLEDAKKR